MKLKAVKDQVVVVMGASTGIGRLTALELARRGAKVVVAARGEESLRTLVEEIRRDGGQVTSVVADISEAPQVEAVAAAAEREFGGLDTWINMAATSVYAPFEKTTPEEFARIIEVNLIGYALGMKAALPRLRARGAGAIVNVSSVEGEVSMPFHSAYAASKHGIEGMSDALRLELKHDGTPISVTSIKPASINTPFFEHAKTKLGVKPRGIPPVYQPEEVVGAILYAAANPIREIVVGNAGRTMIAMRRFMPAVNDAILSRIGFSGQRTKQPRSENARHGLHAPIDGDDRVKLDPAASIRRIREPGFFTLHPKARAFVVMTMAVALFAGVRGYARAR